MLMGGWGLVLSLSRPRPLLLVPRRAVMVQNWGQPAGLRYFGKSLAAPWLANGQVAWEALVRPSAVK